MIAMAASSAMTIVARVQDQVILNANHVNQTTSCQRQLVMRYVPIDSSVIHWGTLAMTAQKHALPAIHLINAQNVMTTIK